MTVKIKLMDPAVGQWSEKLSASRQFSTLEDTNHSTHDDTILNNNEWSSLGFSVDPNHGSASSTQGSADEMSRKKQITLDRIK